MSSMTEEIESSDRKLNRILPKGKIPFFNNRHVGKDKGQHGEEYEHHAGCHVSFELTQETVIRVCHDIKF